MATNQTLSYAAYTSMSQGQRMAWFYDTTLNAHNNEHDINMSAYAASKSYMDITVPDSETSMLAAFNGATRKLMQDLVLGQRSHEDLMFIQVDSSIACYYDINDLVDNLRHQFPDCIPVLVKTTMGTVENAYKLANPEKYGSVDFDMLSHNMSLFEDSEDVDMMHDDVAAINFPMAIEFDFADFAMGHLLASQGCWGHGIRNEVNDDIQIHTLLSILHFIPGCSVVMFTNDAKMRVKLETYRHVTGDPHIFIGTANNIY